jgi:endo-1,4-beta-mannosidase
VIATLGNQYPDCDRADAGNRIEAWYREGYAHKTDAGMPFTYRNWVAQVVTRYRNDPTILAWQLMNEAADPAANGRCSATSAQTLKSFAQDMAGLIKGIDANHLVSLGTMGVRECGTLGAQYQDVHSVTGIDLCEVHDYGTPAGGLASNLQLRIQQCRKLNKPMLIGEMGIRGVEPGTRASLIRNKLASAFGSGVSGVLIWDWSNADQGPYSGYEVQPGDPTLGVLANAL